MDSFNRHQLVINVMMDMNFEGKMNKDVTDKIGARLNEGNKYQEEGDFSKACETFNSIIEDYGFDQSFGEAPDTEQKENQAEVSGDETSSETAAEASSSDDAASAGPGE